MDNCITILIGHYDDGNLATRDRTLKRQISNFKIQKGVRTQIIICDDGSLWSSRFENYNVDKTGYCSIIPGSEVAEYECDYLVRINSKKGYSKPLVMNAAIENCGVYENLLIMDDDWFFHNPFSLKRICFSLKDNVFVVSRIFNRSYGNKMVQGTGIGIKRTPFSAAGKFNYFGYNDPKASCGLDSDLWNTFYHIVVNNRAQYRATYLNQIVIHPLNIKKESRWKKTVDIEKFLKVTKNFFNGVSIFELDCRRHWEWLTFHNGSLDDFNDNKKSSLTGNTHLRNRCVVWGVGERFNQNKDSLIKSLDIIGLIDNNQCLWGKKIEGIFVFAPENIAKLNPELIFICSLYYQDIIEQINIMYPKLRERIVVV